jgi:Peptidase propeptide and YPEB domain
MTDIRKLTTAAILGLSMLAAPMAMAESEEGDVDAATTEKVTAQLTADGYEVRKLEVEDGLIEAYVVKDGATSSLFLNPTTLKVVKIEG